jgi:hypothetical protein
MTEAEATAEVFWTAFKVLPRAEQQAILRRIVRDQNLRHDLIDLALIEERPDEPSRPLRDYLKDTQK